MVRIYHDHKSGEFLVQTTCLDTDAFMADLSEALANVVSKANGEASLSILGVLSRAMPIAYKLSGYKADTVNEQRTLVCGTASPNDSDVVATAGR